MTLISSALIRCLEYMRIKIMLWCLQPDSQNRLENRKWWKVLICCPYTFFLGNNKVKSSSLNLKFIFFTLLEFTFLNTSRSFLLLMTFLYNHIHSIPAVNISLGSPHKYCLEHHHSSQHGWSDVLSCYESPMCSVELWDWLRRLVKNADLLYIAHYYSERAIGRKLWP